MFNITRKKFGEYLIENNKITREQFEKVLEYQQQHRDLKIGEIFYKIGIMEKEQAISYLADYLDKKYILLENIVMTPEVRDIFPIEFMMLNSFAPFKIEDGKLKIAIDDINNFELKADIDLMAAKKSYITEYYLCMSDMIKSYINRSLEERSSKKEQQSNIENDIPSLVNSIIEEGIKRRASDIHIEPIAAEKMRVRYRVDGLLLIGNSTIDKRDYEEVVSRIKIMANLNTTEKRRAQDGQISDVVSKDGQVFDIRVSIVSIVYGEKVVLRLLSKNQNIRRLEELGFAKKQIEIMERGIKHKNGIIFVTGATGTGKSTTLYTLLTELNKIYTNIITIENPVEKTVEGLCQINTNEAIGVGFHNTLKTVLRQDPDVIMVGEVRDKETLSIALEASMTGHLVLTSLHTNSAIQTIDRINSMGVDMFNFATSLILVVSQRLIRKLCPYCKKMHIATENDIAYMESILNIELEEEEIPIYSAVGCPKCNNGFADREVIAEVFEKDRDVEKLIVNRAPSSEVSSYLRMKGFSSLVQQAVNKVLEGKTSLEEVKNMFSDKF
jgi:type IV pilus assembly protein PilB